MLSHNAEENNSETECDDNEGMMVSHRRQKHEETVLCSISHARFHVYNRKEHENDSNFGENSEITNEFGIYVFGL